MTLALLAPSATRAGTVGVGDNNASMFSDPNFQSLGTTISRKVIPYDYYNFPSELASLDSWLAGASAAGIEPLIAFNYSNLNPHKLPSVGEFKLSVTYLLEHYPSVRTISPWNEANHGAQPTSGNPKRAAEFYNATRRLCTRCKIVAADVLDIDNMVAWVKIFQKTAFRPSIWGLHSYADSNDGIAWKNSATKRLLAIVKGKLWLTEVGGLVAFRTRPNSNQLTAAKATADTLNRLNRSRRLGRIYFYNWFGLNAQTWPTVTWDTGLISPSGAPRPAYYVLKNWIAAHR